MAKNPKKLTINGDEYVKVNKTTTNIYFVLDNSGSMSSILSPTIDSFNEYIRKLKQDGNKYRMTLVKFGDSAQTIYEAKDLADISELNRDNYAADGGMTALYDAVCSTLKNVKQLDGSHEKNLVVIMTDGGENASQEYTEKDLNALKKELEKKENWTFVFLGANQDSFAVAARFGIHKGNVANFNASQVGVAATMDSMAVSTSNLARSAHAGFSGQSVEDSFYTKDQQDEMEKAK